jgi:hypothetical protein
MALPCFLFFFSFFARCAGSDLACRVGCDRVTTELVSIKFDIDICIKFI